MNSLSDLLMDELTDLLDAEKQLIQLLPKMVHASQSPALKLILEGHIKVAQEQADRIKDIFDNVSYHPRDLVCQTMKGLVAEMEHVLKNVEKGPDLDTAIISVAQRIQHYEITGYGIAHEHADDLGHTRIVELLDRTINEERVMHLHLSELAQGLINAQAIDPQQQEIPPKVKGGGFYIPAEKFGRKLIKKKSKDKEVSRYIDEGNPNF